MNNNLPILHVVGPKNSGKTSLLQWLIKQLTEYGLKVGALKHSMHPHPVDRKNSDSDLMRIAGARPLAFWSTEGLAIFYPPVSNEIGWKILNKTFIDIDLLLVESFGSALGVKLAIDDGSRNWQNFNNVIAIVSERPVKTDLPVFTKNDPHLFQFILNYFNINTKKVLQ